jgi:hypothetical protein
MPRSPLKYEFWLTCAQHTHFTACLLALVNTPTMYDEGTLFRRKNIRNGFAETNVVINGKWYVLRISLK